MEKKIIGNESAMPIIKTNRETSTYNNGTYVHGDTFSTGGLTIRQHFAAMAMQGLIASCSHSLAIGSNLESYPEIPKEAVEYADALIAELNKEK